MWASAAPRARRALVPGGLFLFDAAGPGQGVGPGPRRVHTEGDGWAVLMAAEEDRRRRLLTRRITTFCRTGKLYRRTEETHRLRLIAREEIEDRLRDAGFRVRVLKMYGGASFLPGVTGFLAERFRGRAPSK